MLTRQSFIQVGVYGLGNMVFDSASWCRKHAEMRRAGVAKIGRNDLARD
jgi:hypothetical protein